MLTASGIYNNDAPNLGHRYRVMCWSVISCVARIWACHYAANQSEQTPSTATLPPEILATSPWRTFPGPTSVKLSAPSEIMFFVLWVHLTGAVSWARRFALISAGSVEGFAVTF